MPGNNHPKAAPGRPVAKERKPVTTELSGKDQAIKNLEEKIERLSSAPDKDDPRVKAAIERAQLYLQNIREGTNEE